MKMMKRVSGKIAFGGIAIGTIKELSKKNDLVRRVHVEDVAAEQVVYSYYNRLPYHPKVLT